MRRGSSFPNHSPVAVISASAISGEAPLEVTFDASQSYDPDDDEIRYEWNFGDGQVAQGKTVQHGFGTSGNYTVKLQVTDSKGKSVTSTKAINVFRPANEITKRQTFDLQNGLEYDTGTGLRVSIPPTQTNGKANLMVTENPTPQQPGGSIEVESVYDVSLIPEVSSQEQKITPKSSLENSSPKVRITFEIPLDMDPHEAMILQWTDKGWVLVGSDDCLGGILSPDMRYIYADLPHLSKYALGNIEKRFEVGDVVVVNAPGGLNIRDVPAGVIIKTVPSNWVLEIVDIPNQPILAEYKGKRYLWWKVREKEYETEPVGGWVIEGWGDVKYLEKCEYMGSPPASPKGWTKAEWKSVADKAIQWATAQEGSDEWSAAKNNGTARCATFVANAFGQATAGYNADDLAEYLKGKGLLYPNPNPKKQIYGNPPRGALIFFKPAKINGGYGHVAIYLGNGEMVNQYVDIRIMPLTDYSTSIGYKGWAYPPWGCLVRSQPVGPGCPEEDHQPEVIHTLTPTLEWEGVHSADRYAIFVSTAVNNDWENRDLIFNSEGSKIEITSTSYKLPSGVLEWDKDYRWNVKAYYPEGCEPISKRLYFHTSRADGTSPPNEPPSVTIISPEDSSTFSVGGVITFQGKATDPEDGVLTGSSLVWTSSIDGQIGTGESFSTSLLSVGTHTITLMATDSDGNSASASINITVGSAGPTPPSPGPSRGKLAFVSDRDGQAEIYVMNADGSNVRRLTYTPGGLPSQAPTWSPDGRKMAFISGGDWDGDGYVGLGLCIMDSDGNNVREIRVSTDLPIGYINNLAWSPDGTRFAFVAPDPTYTNFDVYTMNMHGSDVKKLTTDGKSAWTPSWSPDSKYIAFSSTRDPTDLRDIYIMDADGSNQQWLSNAPPFSSEPAWSPDGAKLACQADYNDIWVISIDGSNQIKLTNNRGGDYNCHPTWSPDGTRVAFVSDRDANQEIYVANPDGSGETRLTNERARDWDPAWSPAPLTASNSQ